MPRPQPYLHFALNLKLARVAAGHSQHRLGRRCRPPLVQETISQLELGKRPTPTQVAVLAKALGVTVETLLAPVDLPLITGNDGRAA